MYEREVVMCESLDSGVSVNVMWVLTQGMHYACEKQQALDAIERLMLLERGDVRSAEDIALAESWIARLLHLPHCVRESIATRVRYCGSTNETAHS